MRRSVYLVLNGPNLNRLGSRQPHLYGRRTLRQLEQRVRARARDLNVHVRFHQSNHEGELIDRLHEAADQGIAGVVLNPGGYTHTSVALLDAIRSVPVPCVEVHLTNIFQADSFERDSITARGCRGLVTGLGFLGYILALEYLVAIDDLKRDEEPIRRK